MLRGTRIKIDRWGWLSLFLNGTWRVSAGTLLGKPGFTVGKKLRGSEVQ
jgi:hypothetical protein